LGKNYPISRVESCPMNWVEVTQILGNFYPFLGRKVTQSYANFFTQFAKTKMGNFLPKKGKVTQNG
jgi:hypothetical protein